MPNRQKMNNWLFSKTTNKNFVRNDHLSVEKRNLLNQHLDGILSKSELQGKLLELKVNEQD